MIEPQMVQDIRNQPASLAGVLDYQLSAGHEALGRAAAQIESASRIVVTGMGASLFAAMPFANSLEGQGMDVRIVEASELLHYQAELCGNALVVLVSRSGESIEILKLLPRLRELNAVTIGVTNEPGSTLAKSADTTVIVNSRNDDMVAVQTYTGTVLAFLILAGTVHGQPVHRMRLDGEAVVRSCADLVTRFLDGDFGWRDFFEGTRVVHVLGRGPSVASAHEGALLFNETAKLPSVAATPGSFRHGPVEIVDQNFRAIVFATQDRTRELDLGFASDLSRMGAMVNVVGPGGTWPIQRIASMFLPILEIVPLQVAALRAAELRGVRAGQFRYVSKVTASEVGFPQT
jgi:glucosamine--fructose-6-phosphate aminotransferase (isomerizing)